MSTNTETTAENCNNNNNKNKQHHQQDQHQDDGANKENKEPLLHPIDEALEKKLVRLEKLAGIERIETIVKRGSSEENNTKEQTKIAIFRNGVKDMDVMRMIAECESLEGSDEAFIVVNLTTICERYHEWCKKLPRVHPFYAIKCNNDPMIAQMLAHLGTGFDCASLGEIHSTVGAGFVKPERIIYANTIKQRSFISEADKTHGVRRMTFDNAEELEKIKELHSSPELVLRIRADDPDALSHLGEKFGCDPPVEKGAELLKIAKEMGLKVVGISFHVGSGCGNEKVFGECIAQCAELFEIGISHGHKMRLLDLGGGFPGTDSPHMTFDRIVGVVNSALDKYFPEGKYEGLEVIAEPGRFFGSAAVSLVAHVIAATKVPASRVTKKKEDEDKEGYMYYLNDGVYGSFNSVLFDKLHPQGRALLISKSDKTVGGKDEPTKKYPSIIWGPTCTNADKVEPLNNIRKLNIGDWLYYPNMGAYTRVSASHFNGFHAPKPYYIMDEKTWDATYGQCGGRGGGEDGGAQKECAPKKERCTEKKNEEREEKMANDGVKHQIVSLFE